ncbi:MAG: hypothetical protein OER80_08265, partial [Gammaproteobacteria bacterium]|nr:hypothetical protein [Gammaproteobacteria bacterium]
RFSMSVGTYEFKLADDGWSFEYTNSGTVPVGMATDLSSGGGSNASITIAEAGCYQWTVTVVDGSAVPAPLVSLLVESDAACPAPPDLGNDPAEAFGAELFARGGFNDWAGAASDPPTNFVNLGGAYMARFSMSTGTYEFKLADDGWSFEYTNSGSVPIGMATDFPGGGGSNASITIPADGCYQWTVAIVDGSAVPAPLVSLLVEQIPTGRASGPVVASSSRDDPIPELTETHPIVAHRLDHGGWLEAAL